MSQLCFGLSFKHIILCLLKEEKQIFYRNLQQNSYLRTDMVREKEI